MNKLLQSKKNMVLCVLSLIFGYLVCMNYPLNKFLEGFSQMGSPLLMGTPSAAMDAARQAREMAAAEADLEEAIFRASNLRAQTAAAPQLLAPGMQTGAVAPVMQTGAVGALTAPPQPLAAPPAIPPMINRLAPPAIPPMINR
jgi:hypothetical protein